MRFLYFRWTILSLKTRFDWIKQRNWVWWLRELSEHIILWERNCKKCWVIEVWMKSAFLISNAKKTRISFVSWFFSISTLLSSLSVVPSGLTIIFWQTKCYRILHFYNNKCFLVQTDIFVGLNNALIKAQFNFSRANFFQTFW